MNNLTPEQGAAIRSIDRNQSVMAGAGTGKTHVLVQRFLHVLEHRPEWPLRSVVAITFTKAAALSMRQRIRREINARACDAPGVWRPRIAELDSLQVTTVHSFCQRLLTEHAVEAGIDPDFEVADEIEAAALRAEAVRCYCRDIDGTELPEVELVRIFESAVFRQVLADLLTKEHLLARMEEPGPVEKTLRDTWEAAHADAEAAVTSEIGHRHRDLADMRTVLEAAARDPNVKGALQTRCAWAAGAVRFLIEGCWSRAREAFNTEDWPKSIRDVGGSKMDPDLKQRCNTAWRSVHDLCARLDRVRTGSVGGEPDEQDREALRLLVLWHSAWKQTNRHLYAVKRERNLLTFDDLELKALRLLKVHAARPDSRVRSAILGINHLLVDEYQDINPLQQEIIGCLAALTSDWVDEGRRPGRLFAVGDTKQSIYRFRGAEVAEFVKLAAAIQSQSAQSLDTLSESFRTHRELIAATNAIFKDVFRPLSAHGHQDYEAVSMDLTSNRGAPVKQPSLEVHTLVEAEQTSDTGTGRGRRDPVSEMKRLAEFDFIANRLREIRESGRPVLDLSHKVEREVRAFRYGDAAILLRTRTHLSLLEEALRERQVPFRVVDGTDLKLQAHIRSVVALLRWLHRPSDRLSLAAALRSPLFGLSDESLFLLAENLAAMGSADGGGEALSELESDQRTKAEFAHWTLSALRAKALVLSPDRLLAEVLGATGYESVLASHEDPYRVQGCLDDLESLQWLAFQCRGEGLGEFLRRLAGQDRQANQREEGTESEDGEAVRIMTVHGAKGLEFPVVFVPYLEHDWTREGPRRPLPVLASNPNHLVCKVPDENGELAEPFSFQLVGEMEKRRQHAESRRLFYVACTRAADLLVLSGWDTKSRKSELWSAELSAALDRTATEKQGDSPSQQSSIPLFAVDAPVVRRHWHERDLAAYRDRGRTAAHKDQAGSLGREERATWTNCDLRLARDPAVADSLTIHAREAAQEGTRLQSENTRQTQRGDLVHEVLGLWRRWFSMSEDELLELVAFRLQGYPLLAAPDATDIQQCLLRLRELPFSQEIDSADRLFTEMPVSAEWAGRVRNLRLDLLFQDGRGDWHLVDWKTGDWSRQPDAARKFFRRQMQGYVQAFAQAFNGVRPRVRLGLLEPEPVFVELDPEELEPGGGV